jgi:hypothetical protein
MPMLVALNAVGICLRRRVLVVNWRLELKFSPRRSIFTLIQLL